MAPRQGPDYPAHDQGKRQENASHQVRCTARNHPGTKESDADGDPTNNFRREESRPHSAIGEVLPCGLGWECSEML
jgi:hypothetical protein